MREDLADLWATPCDARCVTTNGTVKGNGRGVMGRGCALQAKQRYLGLEIVLGRLLQAEGNHVGILHRPPPPDVPLVRFPVKYTWREIAGLELIEQSARELVALTDVQGWQTIVLPRPGCGNGGLKWQSEVRPVIRNILDDRFLVVTV